MEVVLNGLVRINYKKNMNGPVLNCIIIHGNKQQNDFVRNADVFEPFKVLAVPVTYQIEYKVGEVIELKDKFKKLKQGFEMAGENVVAVFVPGDKETAYFDENIKVISDGQRWTTIDSVKRTYKLI